MSVPFTLSTREIDMVRGRAAVDAARPDDVHCLLLYIDTLHGLLDEGDQDDAFGTEGWRHTLGIE